MRANGCLVCLSMLHILVVLNEGFQGCHHGGVLAFNVKDPQIELLLNASGFSDRSFSLSLTLSLYYTCVVYVMACGFVPPDPARKVSPEDFELLSVLGTGGMYLYVHVYVVLEYNGHLYEGTLVF